MKRTEGREHTFFSRSETASRVAQHEQTTWISLQHYFSINIATFSVMIYNDIFYFRFATANSNR